MPWVEPSKLWEGILRNKPSAMSLRWKEGAWNRVAYGQGLLN